MELDGSNQKMNAKIRDFGLQKIRSSSFSATKEARERLSQRAVCARRAMKALVMVDEFIARARKLVSEHAMELA